MSWMKAAPLFALLVACSPSQPPPAPVPKAKPAIDGIIGVRLGDTLDIPACRTPWYERQPKLPCRRAPEFDGSIVVMLPKDSVPQQTMEEARVALLDGAVQSIRVRTFLPIERAAGMLVEKWGAANGPSDHNAIRWTGENAEALLFPDSPEHCEHMILVQTFAYTAAENERRRAEEASSPKF